MVVFPRHVRWVLDSYFQHRLCVTLWAFEVHPSISVWLDGSHHCCLSRIEVPLEARSTRTFSADYNCVACQCTYSCRCSSICRRTTPPAHSDAHGVGRRLHLDRHDRFFGLLPALLRATAGTRLSSRRRR